MKKIVILVALTGLLLVDGKKEVPAKPPATPIVAVEVGAQPDQAVPDQSAITSVSHRAVAVRVVTAPVRAFRNRTVFRGRLVRGLFAGRCGRRGCN